MSGEAIEIRNVVIGTAGHIDHGKSTLVKTLTGIDPDRWQEEKEKGITIDLGFANFVYKDRFRIGIVDVPGHERFVKNMVAGATGIDIVLLVVAADDGVMPQTREHLEILTLLGITRGLVVLNKIDKVDDDTIELAREDIADLVRGTFLESAPVVPVSATTGAGIDGLWEKLGELIEATPVHDITGVFRMPVQRVFSVKGHGAVLTGIPLTGRAAVGDNLIVLPGEQRAKVRGIQAYHMAIEEARAGHSSAFNLAGVDHTQAHRGHTLCTPGVFEPSRYFSSRLTLLESAPRPLKHRAEIKFHVGTSERVGHVHFLERTALQPGESCLCEFLLEEPVVAGKGDYFVIRLPSPALTLGGGRVIRREEEILKRNDKALLDTLQGWADAADEPRKRVEMALIEAGPAGVTRDRLITTTELSATALPALVDEFLKDGTATEFGPSRALIHQEAWSRAAGRMVEILKRFHEQNPAQMGLKAASVQQQVDVDARTFQAILQLALEAGTVEQRGELLGLPGEGGRLSDEARAVAERVSTQLERAALNPPTLKELALAAGMKPQATQNAVDYLVGSGRAHVLPGGVLFGSEALADARNKVTEFLRERGEAAAKDFKEILPTSRKYLIPLLEWMDAQGVTRNVNGVRTLK